MAKILMWMRLGVVMDRWNWKASHGFAPALVLGAFALSACLLGPNEQDIKQAELQQSVIFGPNPDDYENLEGYMFGKPQAKMI